MNKYAKSEATATATAFGTNRSGSRRKAADSEASANQTEVRKTQRKKKSIKSGAVFLKLQNTLRNCVCAFLKYLLLYYFSFRIAASAFFLLLFHFSHDLRMLLKGVFSLPYPLAMISLFSFHSTKRIKCMCEMPLHGIVRVSATRLRSFPKNSFGLSLLVCHCFNWQFCTTHEMILNVHRNELKQQCHPFNER